MTERELARGAAKRLAQAAPAGGGLPIAGVERAKQRSATTRLGRARSRLSQLWKLVGGHWGRPHTQLRSDHRRWRHRRGSALHQAFAEVSLERCPPSN